jgi:hypothetical protein
MRSSNSIELKTTYWTVKRIQVLTPSILLHLCSTRDEARNRVSSIPSPRTVIESDPRLLSCHDRGAPVRGLTGFSFCYEYIDLHYSTQPAEERQEATSKYAGIWILLAIMTCVLACSLFFMTAHIGSRPGPLVWASISLFWLCFVASLSRWL